MSEMTPDTGLHVDVYNVGYDPNTKSMLVPVQLETLTDDSAWLMGNMHKNPQAVTRARMTTDIAWLKHELWGTEIEGGGAMVAGGPIKSFEQQFGTFDQYRDTVLQSYGKSKKAFTPDELSELRAEYDALRTSWTSGDGDLPKSAIDRIVKMEVGDDPSRNSMFFDMLVLENARKLSGGYDAGASEFFAEMYAKPDKFGRAQETLRTYGAWLEPAGIKAGDEGVEASLFKFHTADEALQRKNYAGYRNAAVGAGVPGPAPSPVGGFGDPYAQAFDAKTYWNEQWQLSGGRRSLMPDVAEMPTVPEMLDRSYGNMESALRKEKSQVAASQVGYFNAERWLYELLAGTPADLPAGSRIVPAYIEAGTTKGWGLPGGGLMVDNTQASVWDLPGGTQQTRIQPAVGQVDLKTAMLADVILEQKGLPYYIDWEQVVRGPKGYDLSNLPLMKGRPEDLQPAAWRSGYLRMDEKYQQALTVARGPDSLSSTVSGRTQGLQPSVWGSTQISPDPGYYDAATEAGYLQVGKMGTSLAAEASQLDAIRLQYLPELMQTWEAGGKGSLTASAYNLTSTYRDLSRAAVDAGLVVDVSKPVQLGDGTYRLDYRLRPLAAKDQGWARAGGDPAKVMQGFSSKVEQVIAQSQPGLGALVQEAQAWAGDVRSMLPGTPFERAQGAVAHNAALNATAVPFSPQFEFGPGVVTYDFGLPSTKIEATAPGAMPSRADLLTLLKEGNDPRFVYGTFKTGTTGIAGSTGSLVVQNQQYGASRGWDFYQRIETFLVDKLGAIFGTPAGASATSAKLTENVMHGGSEANKVAFSAGTGIVSSRGRKLGTSPEAHEAYLMGPRLPITEADWAHEAENSDKFDVWGSDEGMSADPNRPGYVMGDENRAVQEMESVTAGAPSDYVYDPKSGKLVPRPDDWLADGRRTYAGEDVEPPQPAVPYTTMPREMAQYDGPNGLRQWFIDRIEMFRTSMTGANPPGDELVRQVQGALNETGIVKIARGTLEKYIDTMKMTGEMVGGLLGKSPVSGDWIWNEAEKKAEWVAREVNIQGTGLHINPNPGGGRQTRGLEAGDPGRVVYLCD